MEAPITFLTKGLYGVVAGTVFHRVFQGRSTYAHEAVASGAAAVSYIAVYLVGRAMPASARLLRQAQLFLQMGRLQGLMERDPQDGGEYHRHNAVKQGVGQLAQGGDPGGRGGLSCF